MKNRSEKAALIAQIQEAAGRASFAVVTDFKGMSVEELTGLRVALRAAGGEYHVVKNTLARIALADTDHSAVSPALKNNSAIALGFQDPVGVAKALSDFAKTNNKLAIRMGALDGKAMTAAQVTLGEYSIIGAGGVVIKDIPAWTTAVGVPARVIKTREKEE